MRDLWRRGSGMTLRRLGVLIRGLPPESMLWAEVQTARDAAMKPSIEQIRARRDHYKAKKAERGD